ncbi:MAG: hypothetical protein Q4C96_06115 [Planctomycetia bacterium]|nr:hypothetical protein [Planctomycetia bacterium]
MKIVSLVFCLSVITSLSFGQEVPVKSSVKSLGIFKNGVVVVQEEIQVPGSGRYLLEQTPVPIHGTFFIESDAVVETTVTRRNVTELFDREQTLDLQNDLAGQKVRFYFADKQGESVEGIVSARPEVDLTRTVGVSRSSAGDRHSYLRGDYSGRAGNVSAGFSLNSMIMLETENGNTFLTGDSIYRVDVDKKLEKIQRKRSVLLFHVKTEKPATIRLFYLTRGMAWAPSYRIAILDGKRLSIQQNAAIMNELRQLEDTEVSLISGFPKIEYQHVNALFSSSSSLDIFFRQLAQGSRSSGASVLTQQVAMNALPPDSYIGETEIVSGSEGPDVHFQKIGKRSLHFGDSLLITTGEASTDYERIVECTIPDSRDAWGRYQGQRNNEKQLESWDILRFRNPLSFPMTTAPATIIENGQFFGQNTSYWAAPGEKTSIPITKSMNVRVFASESQRNNNNTDGSSPVKYVTFQGYKYIKTIVDVELTVVNRRAEPIKMLLQRGFSGELEQPVPDATVKTLAEQLNSVNRKQEIQWEFTLSSGERKKITYSYVIWIRQ